MCKNWHSRKCDCCSYWDIISLLVVVSAAQGHCGLSSITNRIFSSSPAGKSTSTMNFSSTTTENLVCRFSRGAQSALSHQPAKNEHRQMTWPRLYTTKLVNVGEPEDGDRRRCDHVVTSDNVLIQWRRPGHVGYHVIRSRRLPTGCRAVSLRSRLTRPAGIS